MAWGMKNSKRIIIVPMAWKLEIVDKNDSADGLEHEIADVNNSGLGHGIVNKNNVAHVFWSPGASWIVLNRKKTA